MPRASTSAIHRTDLHHSNLTRSKEDAVLDMLAAYRAGAVALADEQWRLFFETGRFNKFHDTDKVRFVSIIGAANRVQMARYQVVGVLQSWISNRANEFRDMVIASSLPSRVKHQLFVINLRKVWFSRDVQLMPPEAADDTAKAPKTKPKRKKRVPEPEAANSAPEQKGEDAAQIDATVAAEPEVIPDDVRKLARSIMRHVMSCHRRPNLARISMRLDHRAGQISRPVKATQIGKVSWWINLSTMEKGQKIKIPLLTNPYHEKRGGQVSTGIQINEKDGRLTFGVVTDIHEACEASRAVYAEEKRDPIALDFGLTTIFATSEGQLLGQNWLKQLKKYDALISMIAASQQRAGKKPRDSKRYRALVQDVRGFLTTEINRILNRLVAQNRPSELILEKLDFRHSDLSKRLNRILRNSGRSIISAKLQDLEDCYGVKHTEVNPAYTSQTCSSCGYVDKRNRTDQSHFLCRWCGSKKHADLNAATNVRTRRVRPHGWLFQGKAKVLVALVTEFNERQVGTSCPRRSGSKGAPTDPRLKNPYFTKQATPVQETDQTGAVRLPDLQAQVRNLPNHQPVVVDAPSK